MSRPTRGTAAGRAYLDLQNRARREGRGTQQLLIMYVVERWLARLSRSAYVDDFVLKGGMADPVRRALEATAAFRGTTLMPLAEIVDTLVALRSSGYVSYRRNLGLDGGHLPEEFIDVVRFVDPLISTGVEVWDPAMRRWK